MRNTARFAAALLSAVFLFSTSCSFDLEHEGPYDPNAPAEKQAKASVFGYVELQGETDYAGVDVLLQNEKYTYTVQTDQAGAFKITGIVPGEYTVRYSVKSFQEYAEQVRVPLAERVELDRRLLLPRSSQVTGTAVVQRLVNRTPTEEGGVVVALEKNGSIRDPETSTAPVLQMLARPSLRPLANPLPTYSTVSLSDGSFTLDNVPAGRYNIIASNPGQVTLVVGTLTVTGEEESITLEPITLSPLTGYMDVFGRVNGAWTSREYTDSDTVRLRLMGISADQVAIGTSDDGRPVNCEFDAPVPYEAEVDYRLPAEGRWTICVKYIADDGRETDALTADIVYDRTPPTNTGILLNNGALYATDPGIIVNLTAFDPLAGVDRMAIYQAPADATAAPRQDFVPALVVPVAALDPLNPDGTYTYYVRFFDHAGNGSAPVSASITLDSGNPTLAAFQADDGFGAPVFLSRSTQLNLRLVADDLQTPLSMRISNTSDFAESNWRPYQETFQWNVAMPTDPIGESRTVYAMIRDAAGNTPTVNVVSWSVVVDTIAPLFDGLAGPQLSNDDVINLTLTASGASEMRISEDPTFASAPWTAYRATTTYTVSPAEGNKTIYAQLRDQAGNLSLVRSLNLVLDKTPPPAPYVQIQGGGFVASQQYINNENLSLQVLASDVMQMRISQLSDFSDATWQPFTPVRNLTLAGVDGDYTVYVQLRDAAGNVTSATPRPITLDRSQPVLESAFEAQDQGGATITQTNNLYYYLYLKVTDANPLFVQYSSSESFLASATEEYAYSGRRLWYVPAPTNAEGEDRQTWARILDAAGNTLTVGPITVRIKTAGPTNPNLSITATETASPNITVVVSADNAVNVQIANNLNFFNPTTLPVSPGVANYFPYTLSSGDGVKNLYARFQDSLGNYSQAVQASVLLDSTPPVVTNFTIDGGKDHTRALSGSVPLNWTVLDLSTSVEAAQLVNVNAGSPCDETTLNTGTTLSFTAGGVGAWPLAAPTGANQEGLRVVCARFQDRLGNWSTPVTDTIQYDTMAPVANATPLINGGAAYTNSGQVTMTLDVSGASQMLVANDAFFTNAQWLTYQSSFPHVINTGGLTATVYLKFRDPAGNETGIYSDAINYDGTKPALGSPAIAINSGAAFTTSTSVGLTLSASDATALRMRISNDGAFDTEPYLAYASTYPWTLDAVDGTRTVAVKFYDEANNETDAASTSIVLDRAAPSITSFIINRTSPALTKDPLGNVLLSIDGQDTISGLDRMRIANLGAAPSCNTGGLAWQEYAFGASLSWQLEQYGAGVEAEQFVCATFSDRAGNWSTPVSDSILYDFKAPEAYAGGILVENGATHTISSLVSLAMSVTGATEMIIGFDGTFSGSAWESYRTFLDVALPSGPGDGVRSVGVRFRDSAGNVTGEYWDSITLDTQPPVFTQTPAVTLNGGATYATTNQVDLQIFGSGAAWMQISNDGTFAQAPIPYSPAVTAWTLAPGDGIRFVYVRLLDNAGHAIDTFSTVEVDTLAPTPVSIVLNGGATATNAPASVVATFSAGGNAVQMRFSQAGCAIGSWVAYDTSATLDLGTTQGLRRVYAEFQDAAGNVSTCVHDDITVDSQFWSPGFAIDITGASVFAGRTAALNVDVTFVNATTDVAELQLSTSSTFSGATWFPATSLVGWALAAGDGVKTLYARARDAAGNEIAAAVSASVTLDQTPPGKPSIALADMDGDGYKMKDQDIELALTVPAAADLERIVLRRQVDGVDGAFLTLVDTVCPCPTTWRDTTDEAYFGLVHRYQLQAYDDLGNASTVSDTLSITPIRPAERLTWVRNATNYHYEYGQQGAGVTLTQAYHNGEPYPTGSPFSNQLAGSTSWDRTVGTVWIDESIDVRVSNEGSVLNYRSRFPLEINDNLTLDPLNDVGADSAVALDPHGGIHIAYYDATAGDLRYMSNVTGAWDASLVDSAGDVGQYGSVAVDMYGNAHIAYYDQTNGALKYATNKDGGWVSETAFADAATDAGRWSSIAVDRWQNVYISFYNAYGVTAETRYVARINDVWGSPIRIDHVGAVQPVTDATTGIAVDRNGTVHVTWHNVWAKELRYATHVTGSAAFSAPSTVDTGDSGQFNSLAVDAAGTVHIAYFKENGAADQLKYASGSPGAWTLTTITTTGGADVGAYASLALSATGVHVAYLNGSAGLGYATNTSGSWVVRTLDDRPSVGLFASLAVDTTGALFATHYDAVEGDLVLSRWREYSTHKLDLTAATSVDDTAVAVDSLGFLHIAFRDGGGNTGELKYATNRPDGLWRSELVDTVVDVEWPSIGVAGDGTVHMFYYDDDNNDLRYATGTFGAWTVETRESVDDSGIGASVAVDAGGKVHAVYYFEDGSGNDAIRYVTNKDGFWARSDVDTVDVADEGSYVQRTGIRIDGNGKLYVTYRGMNANGKATLELAMLEGTTWTVETGQSLSNKNLGYRASLAVTPEGTVHIAHYDSTDTLLRYASRASDGTWSRSTIDTGTKAGQKSAIQADADGKVHVVHYNDSSDDLWYVTNRPGYWAKVVLDASTNDIGNHPALAVDRNGRLFATYVDNTSGTQKLKLLYDFAGTHGPSQVIQE